ncbi:MAG: dimethylsulfide dehydrogenase [Gammaproteobacteria bacterium]|nr:MAG: dimethylsulfide dehydrogenase [Gammaproteobacteria bacterium]RLA57499.1 MAG: dimethylsulfide dehydrogenase [Gammaproteobacteria bacterium]HDY82102.1 dimethylsulfide dehydrogenase [Halieaceae bacterium]
MKITIALLLSAAMLAGCSSSGPEAPTGSKPKAAAVVIDNTPVEPLEIGGSISLLQASGDLRDPQAAGWREAQEYSMDLGMAPPVHQSINLRLDDSAAPQPIYVRAASDGKKLYLRLRWPDASENAATSRTDFADGVAVQFALGDPAADGSPTTSFMMGAPNGPVNIWYWKAGQAEAQNLAAGGFGSTTPLDTAGLESSSVFRDNGEWVVVFSRPLLQSGEHLVNLESGTASVAFALWQGDQRQRDGLKHVSMGWVSLEPAL